MLKISKTWLALALPLLLLASAAACDDGKSDVRPTAEIQAEWNEFCDTQATCPDGNPATNCKEGFSCMEAAMRADMLDKAVACMHARTCDSGSDDACYSLEAQGLTPSAAAASFRDDCLAKRTTCGGEGTSFSDDYCFNAGILQDGTISTLSTCLSGECAGMEACFDTAINAAAPGCS